MPPLPRSPLLGAALLAAWATGGASLFAQTPPTITLRDAVRLALAFNPSLRPASDRVALSEIQRRVAESAFGFKITPSFGSGGNPYGLDQQSLGLSVSKKLVTGAQLSLTADRSSWRTVDGTGHDARDGGYVFNMSQPLLRGIGPATTAPLVSARRGVERSERQLRESRQQMVVDVAETYFAIVRHKRLVATSALAYERARRLKAASTARADVGLATQLDVLRADLLAARSEADLELQREGLASALDALKLAIGRAPDSPLDVAEPALADDPFGVDGVVSRPIEELVAQALATRADVAESREQIDDARRNQSIARWNLLPDLKLNVSYARRGFGSPDAAYLNDLFGGWRMGVSSSFSLDQSAQAASMASAGIELLGAEQNAIDTERRVIADLRRAHRAWLRSAGTMAIQQKTVEMADKQLRLAQLRYERGIANNFDVIDAEHQVAQAEAALIDAEISRQLAGLALLRATGALSPEELAR